MQLLQPQALLYAEGVCKLLTVSTAQSHLQKQEKQNHFYYKI